MFIITGSNLEAQYAQHSFDDEFALALGNSSIVRLTYPLMTSAFVTKAFDSALPMTRSIQELNLNQCPLSYSDIVYIVTNTRLSKLSFNCIDLSKADLTILADHPTLTHLTMRSCSLSDEIVECLFVSNRLTKLVLTRNNLTDETIWMAMVNTSIKALGISHNKISEEGLINLVRMNTTIQELSVENVDCSDAFFDAVCHANVLNKLYCKVASVKLRESQTDKLCSKCTSLEFFNIKV